MPTEPVIETSNKGYVIATYVLVSVVAVLAISVGILAYKLIKKEQEFSAYKAVGDTTTVKIRSEVEVNSQMMSEYSPEKEK